MSQFVKSAPANVYLERVDINERENVKRRLETIEDYLACIIAEAGYIAVCPDDEVSNSHKRDLARIIYCARRAWDLVPTKENKHA